MNFGVEVGGIILTILLLLSKIEGISTHRAAIPEKISSIEQPQRIACRIGTCGGANIYFIGAALRHDCLSVLLNQIFF